MLGRGLQEESIGGAALFSPPVNSFRNLPERSSVGINADEELPRFAQGRAIDKPAMTGPEVHHDVAGITGDCRAKLFGRQSSSATTNTLQHKNLLCSTPEACVPGLSTQRFYQRVNLSFGICLSNANEE